MTELSNFTRFKINSGYFKGIVEKILTNEGSRAELSISLVGSEEIKRLNKKYRKIDKPTDVLSFIYKNSGEIVLCPQIIKKNAERYKERFQKELKRVLIHGILHILGYEHERNEEAAQTMIKKEEKYLKSL